MKKFEKDLEKEKGHKIAAGDFNFAMDAKLDKRCSRKDSGTEEIKTHQEWGNNLDLVDK